MQTKKNKTKGKDIIHLQYKKAPSYAEDLKVVQSFYNQVKHSMVNEEDRLRNFLSGHFQRPVEIINEYLCFGEYLNELSLKTLANSQIGKNFFERAQKVKRILVKNYRDEGCSDHEVTKKISQAVLEMFCEYNKSGKINTKNWQRFYWTANEFNKKRRTCKMKDLKIVKIKKFKYWSVAEEPTELQNKTSGAIR